MPEAKEVCQPSRIQLARDTGISEKSLYLRSKRELAAALVVVQRFFTYAITRKKESLPRSIPNRNREHAIKTAEAIDTPFFVGMQDYFGIASCAKDMASVFQLRAQIEEIVKLAIKNKTAAMIFIPDRLMTSGAGR